MLWLSVGNLVWSIKVSYLFPGATCDPIIYNVLDISVNDCPAKGLNITGSFQINDVGCLGMENSLLQCCHTEDVADCVDTEAVVVECEGGVYLHVCISNDTPKRYVCCGL